MNTHVTNAKHESSKHLLNQYAWNPQNTTIWWSTKTKSIDLKKIGQVPIVKPLIISLAPAAGWYFAMKANLVVRSDEQIKIC